MNLSVLSSASNELTVEFPNLFHGTEILYSRSFGVFGVQIYWYGILIALGVVLAYIYAMRRVTRDFGIVKDRAFDVIFAAIIGGFLFARIYYCVFRNLEPGFEPKYNVITMFTTIRDGGIAIYGGIIGAVVIGFIFCRIRKVNFFAMADLASLGFLIGQSIGRWGNFINQEAYGDYCSPDWIFGMTGSRIAEEMGSAAPVHPCFLYESTWCLLGFIFLHIYSKKLRSYDGELSLLYIAWYGFGRMFIEGLRTDSLYWGSFRVSQVLAAVSFTAAIILLVVFKIITKKKGTVLYVNSDASKALIEHDLEVERQRKAKKNGTAPSILGDDTEKSEESTKESDSAKENSEEPAPAEENTEEPASEKEKPEESAPAKEKSEESAPTVESAEEPALKEEKTDTAAISEEKSEEPAPAEESAGSSDNEDKKSAEDDSAKESASDENTKTNDQ
ncbi:MAG: prolipoprotein diacylglyceryl transferase [Oscillospiraceae bacterium]|nr:prolipoprotein diacylglyceryl transferase [Oscillospiraceae bacterium]